MEEQNKWESRINQEPEKGRSGMLLSVPALSPNVPIFCHSQLLSDVALQRMRRDKAVGLG